MNPINAENDLLNQILAYLPPVGVQPNPLGNQGALLAPPVAQAAWNLAQQMPAPVLQVPPPQLPVQGNNQAAPPGQPVQQQQPPPGALRPLAPGVHQFPRARRNLGPLFDALAPAPATPPSVRSNQSSQSHFSPPSVCKPGVKRSNQNDDSDSSPGTGHGHGIRF